MITLSITVDELAYKVVVEILDNKSDYSSNNRKKGI